MKDYFVVVNGTQIVWNEFRHITAAIASDENMALVIVTALNKHLNDLNDLTVQVEPEDGHLESDFDDRQDLGWPGDGSGEDDLADFNANEADDYRDE